MKKCPECGNPSYDGAPVCGNCGYKFPKPKVAIPKEENIFREEPTIIKSDDNESTIDIIKENKIVIGAILLITIIVIGIIIVTGPNNNDSSSQTDGLVEYSANGFTFNYPSNWEETNGSDINHEGAIFFKNSENTTIEYYNVTSDSASLKEITQERISYAQESGDYIDTVQTITLDGRNASDIILENADGDYTRFVSMFSNGELYVFKITGDSLNSLNSTDIQSVLNSADIA